ncbi:MAG: carboxypeptidase-like regulatory domain-containing protein, partial [Terracidiphilus sp.]
MRQAKYWIFLLPLFFVLVCVGAFAQANSEITGIVTDQTGAVVAGADVSVVDPTTGFTRATVSGPTGLFDIAGLNPANYNLTVTAKGFEKFVQTGIVVNVSGTFRVDAKLTLGAETQTVSVVADALAVQTDSNVVSTLINSEEISEIATENRNFAGLAALGLGVSSGLPDSNTPGAVGSSFTISVNGLRESHNIWLIDGGESDDRGGAGGMQIQPSQDAIAEFQMLTSSYPPDYGISSGATMSLSLKSGTKTFHGSGWEENRATAYDANYYFNKYNGT